jgi:ectoine hydroxylase-related dioxygenase (phytanoyl-CoA dioxygenase family)
MPTTTSLQAEVGVFAPDRRSELAAFLAEHGFAVLRGLWPEEQVATVEAECAAAQTAVLAGELAERHGNAVLVDDEQGRAGPLRFANYVQYVTEVAPAVRAAVLDPVVVELMDRWVPGGHLQESSRFGVVYQDARPGRESGYTRIGWHSDWQSGPHLDRWPSVAFTIHIDPTSPANGFLRVVPGSHRWATPAPFRNANGVAVPPGAKPTGGHTPEPPPFEMPLGFEKIRGELAVYCERGDVLFHDAYLWHSAARATDDHGIRRHVRGGWFSGSAEVDLGDGLEDFVKNAAR